MTAPALARLTSVLVVAAGALTLGHVLRPFGPGATAADAWRPAVFVLAVAALGAWRGWREAAVWAAWERARAPHPHAGRTVAGALAAVLAAALGYVAAHGLGR